MIGWLDLTLLTSYSFYSMFLFPFFDINEIVFQNSIYSYKFSIKIMKEFTKKELCFLYMFVFKKPIVPKY